MALPWALARSTQFWHQKVPTLMRKWQPPGVPCPQQKNGGLILHGGQPGTLLPLHRDFPDRHSRCKLNGQLCGGGQQ
ncbi:unnamed protein product [Lampetra fluviatilis]